MDIPSLFMIPSAVSSGKVHSVFPNSTDADFDFNRDSSATRVNSQGLIEEVGYFGSELVTNGNFDTDSNWSKTSGTIISNGKATITVTGGGYQSVAQSISLSNTKKYRVTAVVNGTSGKAVTFVDNSANNGGLTTSNGVITLNGQDQNVDITWTANSNSGEIEIIRNGSGDFSFTVDNVSVKEVTGDRARLNYEIEGGLVITKPSLLLENQSTNLVTYSEDYANSSWTKTGNTTVSNNTIISPDGTQNASTITTSNTSHSLFFNFTSVASTQYTLSFYAKRGTMTNLKYRVYDLSNDGDIVAPTSYYAQTNTDRWERITLTFTTPSGCTSARVYPVSNSGVTGTMFLFGCMVEQQSYSTSYIPTNGSVQSRASETCNGAGTSSIFESSEGILYVEMGALANDGSNRKLSISNGTNQNVVVLQFTSVANQLRAFLYNGALNVNMYNVLSNSTNFNKIAFKFKTNDFSLYVNGSEVATDTSGTTFSAGTINELTFDDGGVSDPFYGKIRDIRVYNTKEMTDSEVDILLTKITS